MAAISDNKYDVYSWLIKVIDSCTDGIQLQAAHKLLSNFYSTFKDYGMYSELDTYWCGNYSRTVKQNSIQQ